MAMVELAESIRRNAIRLGRTRGVATGAIAKALVKIAKEIGFDKRRTLDLLSVHWDSVEIEEGN